MNTIKVVGLGPGGAGYMLPVCLEAVQNADVLAGAKRHLDALDTADKGIFIIEGQLTPLLAFIRDHAAKYRIAVVVSGDTGFYSLFRYLKKNMPDMQFTALPGLSAMSLMFARLGMMYDDAYIGSVHGKELKIETLVETHGKVGLLTDHMNTPKRIAQRIIDAGVAKKTIAVGERLSYPDERIRKMTLEEAAKGRFESLSIVVIYDEDIEI